MEAGMTTPPEYIGMRIYLGEQFVLPLTTCWAEVFGIWARSLPVNPVPIRGWNYPRSWANPLSPFRSYQGSMVTRCEGPMDTGTAPTLRPATVALGKVPRQPPARKL